MKENAHCPFSKHSQCWLGARVLIAGIFLLLPFQALLANPNLRPGEPPQKFTPPPPSPPAPPRLETREHYLATSRPPALQVAPFPQSAPDPARKPPSLEAFLARKENEQPEKAEASPRKPEEPANDVAPDNTPTADESAAVKASQETVRVLGTRPAGLFQDDYTHQLTGLSEILYFLETREGSVLIKPSTDGSSNDYIPPNRSETPRSRAEYREIKR